MRPMTQLMGRPLLGLPSELGARSALADLLTGVRTALLTVALVAVPVLGLWVLAPYGDQSAAGATRLALALWLLGHCAPLGRGAENAPLTVAPLLLTALSTVLLVRAGRRVAGRGRRQWRAPMSVCAGYLLVAAAAVTQCTAADAPLRARPVADLTAVALLAGGALAYGARTSRYGRGSGSRAADWWARRAPAWACPPGSAAVVARAVPAWLLGLVASGGGVLAVAVVLGEAGRSARTLGGGPAGYLGMLLACAMLLPNAVVWAASYALGPGFLIGTGSAAGPFGVRLGAVPDFPLLALAPDPGGPDWKLAACALPLLAAVVPALLLGRAASGGRDGAGGRGGTGSRGAVSGAAVRPGAPYRDPYGDDPYRDPYGDDPYRDDPYGVAERPGWDAAGTAVAALLTALLGGTAVALAAWAAGGALAAGRMSELGPVPWLAGLAAAGWLALTAVPGALAVRWWHLRGTSPSWWQRLDRLAVRYSVRPRVALHRALVRLAELPSPFTRRTRPD